MLKEYDNIKDKIKNLKTWTAHRRFYSIYKIMKWYWNVFWKKNQLKICNDFINMTEKDICQWLKNRKINDYFNIEINQRELFSDKNEKVCTTLN